MLPKLNPFTGSGKAGDQSSSHNIHSQEKEEYEQKEKSRALARFLKYSFLGEASVKIVTSRS